MQTLRLNLSKFLSILFSVFSIFVITGSSLARANPNSTLQSILDNTPYYNSSSSACSAISGTFTIPSISTSASTSGTWTGTATQPYYLEEFAINVLQDLAGKMNIPTSDTVTQEHVIALIAWFFKEGGNINNLNLFNPLNVNNLSTVYPDLAAIGDATSPPSVNLESFASYNDGVEGTARTFVGSNQDRIAAVLINPSSSAEQVATAIANYQNYPGNSSWEVPYDTTYLPNLLILVENVRDQYYTHAANELGVAYDTSLVPQSELVYGSGSSSQATGLTSCSSSVSCNNGSSATGQLSTVRQTVVCLAESELQTHWTPEPTSSPTPTTGYMYYVNYSEGAQEEWCADFVSWIFNKAGDPFTGGRDGWDLAGVEQIEDQGTSNSNFTWHPYTSNYIPVPGDIAIFSWGGQANPNWAQSHTAIVTAVDTGSKTVTYLGGDQSNPLEEINGDDETEYGGPDSNSLLSYMPSSSGGYYYNNLVEGYVSPN